MSRKGAKNKKNKLTPLLLRKNTYPEVSEYDRIRKSRKLRNCSRFKDSVTFSRDGSYSYNLEKHHILSLYSFKNLHNLGLIATLREMSGARICTMTFANQSYNVIKVDGDTHTLLHPEKNYDSNFYQKGGGLHKQVELIKKIREVQAKKYQRIGGITNQKFLNYSVNIDTIIELEGATSTQKIERCESRFFLYKDGARDWGIEMLYKMGISSERNKRILNDKLCEKIDYLENYKR